MKKTDMATTKEDYIRLTTTEAFKLQECRATPAQIPAMLPKREMIPRSHRGTFIPVMKTEE